MPAEDRFKRVIDRSPAGVAWTTEEGRVLECNDAFARLLGFNDRHEATGKDLRLFYPDQEDRVRTVQKLLEAGHLPAFETPINRTDGSTAWLLVSATVVRETPSAPIVFEVIALDMTERRRQEEAMRRQAERTEALAEISRVLAETGLNYQESLDTVVRAIAELFGDACILRLIAEDQHTLEPTAYFHPDPAGLELLRRFVQTERLDINRGIPGEVLRTGRSVFMARVQADFLASMVRPETLEQIGRARLFGLMAVPLKLHGAPIGVLALARFRRQPPYTATDLAFLNALADRAALAIGNSRLVRQLQLELEQRRKTEAERSRLSAILDATPDVVVIASPEGHLLYVNPAGQRILDAAGDDLASVRIGDYRTPEDRAFMWDVALPFAVEHGMWQGETKLVLPEETIPIFQTIIAHKTEEGRVEFFSTVIRDIREQKQLEEQLRHSQKMEAVGHLAGGIAHDFNNLLTVIGGYSAQLLDDAAPGTDARAGLDAIRRAADKAASLTRQLLAFGRRQMLQPEVLNLKELIADIIEQMLRRIIGEDVHLVTVIDPDLGNIRADRGQIEQVLMNLVVNARDAMPLGGALTVRASNFQVAEFDAIRAEGLAPGSYVALYISDTGTGIDVEVLPHIFEPFFTTKEVGKGTGLGLSTVYGIVKQSGGHIRVRSDKGHGSTFETFFPRIDAAATSCGEPVAAAEAKTTGVVLVVEDDAGVRSLVEDALTRSGFTVIVAANGNDAVSLCRRREEPIDILLTDVVMPGMSGRELAEVLSGMRPGLKVLYMSGHTDDAILHHGILDDHVAFIAKPFSPMKLASTVRNLLR